MLTRMRVRSEHREVGVELVDAPSPRRVVPLMTELGMVAGHRFVLLSIEDWAGWFDLRFARIDTAGNQTLPRRIPPAHAWVIDDLTDRVYTVDDAVGRGDRHLSIGEVRVVPGLPDGATSLQVEARVLGNGPALRARVDVPPAD